MKSRVPFKLGSTLVPSQSLLQILRLLQTRPRIVTSAARRGLIRLAPAFVDLA